MHKDWQKMTAAALGRSIEAGETDPVDLTEAFLEAADAHPETGRIYARMTRDRAVESARAASARARSGERLGPLDGVPVSWKDLFDTTGVATESGSRLLAGRIPGSDAEVIRLAEGRGIGCLGKTHMSELAFSGLGYNPMTETSPNIHDTARAPGGSSSGAAASVAFGLAPAAIGSDTGGSVRLPSAWNDLVGLKTTAGLISVQGTVPLCDTYDTVGPLVRSVEDAALLLTALGGPATDDLTAVDLNGVRLAVPDGTTMQSLDPVVAQAFDAARTRIEAAGATFATIRPPEFDAALSLAAPLIPSEAYANWKDEIEENPDNIFVQVRERFRAGASILATEYLRAWKSLLDQRKSYLDRVSDYDAVLLPTVPSLPPLIEDLAADPDYYVSQNLLALRNTRIGNLLGLCALTLPTGVASCGVMLFGAPFEESRLLRLGAACEQALAVR